ncbi:late expression factor 2 [Neodiprion sertifer nucleopolyhedrovirus]|uniref:Late expression factor 2 n=1 Tax=Neodiprion sertifer nucleopolyhedrovirus TaxID=111874 RepID=Q9QAB3_9CBAC|nr:late expression factor 2 [Neodiprion sertifer nucleopolyhedrovirus]AAF24989.1 late expression factor 2 [Neodiprion sertifer nucleopolyhedrovirus]AAQ96434.1 late expression factor 2 [Neodiprion sertifer nucleopolyhedrovirus]
MENEIIYIKSADELKRAQNDDLRNVYVHYTLYSGILSPLQTLDKTRLYVFVKNVNDPNLKPKNVNDIKSPSKNHSYKRQRYPCFNTISGSTIHKICNVMKPPPCVRHALKLIDERPMKHRFQQRFVVQTYMSRKYLCESCTDNECLNQILSELYHNEKKCMTQLKHCTNNKIKPYNCSKMQTLGLCNVAVKCSCTNLLSW